MRSNGARGGRSPELFHRRLMSKIKQYDMIYKMYVKGKDRFTSDNPLGVPIWAEVKKIAEKRDADDDKKSILYNILVERTSHAPRTNFVWYLPDFPNHRKGARGGGLIEEHLVADVSAMMSSELRRHCNHFFIFLKAFLCGVFPQLPVQPSTECTPWIPTRSSFLTEHSIKSITKQPTPLHLPSYPPWKTTPYLHSLHYHLCPCYRQRRGEGRRSNGGGT